MPRFLIAAAHKSSGKTVISTGLAAAFSARGTSIQCFKKGPDYIDPMWLSAASHAPCYNLDFNSMNPNEISTLLARKSAQADLAMIEANKGLYDGVKLDGSDSNAALAKTVQAPVVLVIDTLGMTRGIAPLLVGYQAFDPELKIEGVILNKVGGARHESKLRAAVEAYTDIAVVGSVWRNKDLDIGERHLGLTTPAETGELNAKITRFGEIVGQSVDLDALLSIAGTAPKLACPTPPVPAAKFSGLKIGIAQDRAFGFYYPDDLEAFQSLGAELIPFDTLTDTQLPDMDGLFIGGGFPETQMEALTANTRLRSSIRTAIKSGLPTYAECGGLMYLCRSLRWNDTKVAMCNVVQGDAVMCPRPQGRGYAAYHPLPSHPWGPDDRRIAAHEFHYAKVENLPEAAIYARKIARGHGIDGSHDGVVVDNLLAGFCHLRNSDANPWVERFLGFVQQVNST